MRSQKYTGDIEEDTILLPYYIACSVGAEHNEVEPLANRARRLYRIHGKGSLFVRRVMGAKGRDYLSMFMAHWLEAMRGNPSRYRERNAADFAENN